MPIVNTEKLIHGESSKDGNLTYVHPSQFAKRLAELHRGKKNQAIYTDGVESRAQYYLHVNDGRKFFQYDAAEHTKRTFVQHVQHLRMELANDAMRNVFSHEVYQDRMNFLNSVEKTVQDILPRFPDRRVSFVLVHHTERYAKGTGTVEWHKDRDFNARGRVTVIATVLGPSTRYHFDNSKRK